MRLWSLDPKYLDCKGLTALWREGLLALKALKGETRSYVNHPQLDRFKAHTNPVSAIHSYLYFVWLESKERGYKFDKRKIRNLTKSTPKIKVTRGQLAFEFKHLKKKLKKRAPLQYKQLLKEKKIKSNGFFLIVAGPKAIWEKG